VVIKEGDVGISLGRKKIALTGGVGLPAVERADVARTRGAGPAASWARPTVRSEGRRSGPCRGNEAYGSATMGL
jgi:hypothetical protein